MELQILEKKELCRQAWERMWPVKTLFDLWSVRKCFHDAFNRPLRFHTLEHNGEPIGFLPLVWSDETDEFVMFPGETWHGKTWIEQNRMIAKTPQVMAHLLESVAGPFHLRYLLNPGSVPPPPARFELDEIGYLFYPGVHDFSFDSYWLSFSGKTRKKLKADLSRLDNLGMSFHFNREKDLISLLDMNLKAFGENSYFSDPRFYESFENLIRFLASAGMLRITTICVKNKIAAVDVGAIFKNSYTLLAGGTNPEFPGIAKRINLHHLEFACNSRMDSVDFLCGNFNWKERFHLAPRPLYKMISDKNTQAMGVLLHEQHAACA